MEYWKARRWKIYAYILSTRKQWEYFTNWFDSIGALQLHSKDNLYTLYFTMDLYKLLIWNAQRWHFSCVKNQTQTFRSLSQSRNNGKCCKVDVWFMKLCKRMAWAELCCAVLNLCASNYFQFSHDDANELIFI